MTAEEAYRYLSGVSGWQIEEDKKIKKEFRFQDFPDSMDFVNKVARLSEEEGHHPVIFINYNKLLIIKLFNSDRPCIFFTHRTKFFEEFSVFI